MEAMGHVHSRGMHLAYGRCQVATNDNAPTTHLQLLHCLGYRPFHHNSCSLHQRARIPTTNAPTRAAPPTPSVPACRNCHRYMPSPLNSVPQHMDHSIPVVICYASGLFRRLAAHYPYNYFVPPPHSLQFSNRTEINKFPCGHCPHTRHRIARGQRRLSTLSSSATL